MNGDRDVIEGCSKIVGEREGGKEEKKSVCYRN